MIRNGSFEEHQLKPRSYEHYESIPGWRLTSGAKIELQRGLQPAADGQQYVELASDAPTAITQDVPTEAGAMYELRFAYSPRPQIESNEVEVRWGDKVVATASGDGSGVSKTSWSRHRVVVTGYGPRASLTFVDKSAVADDKAAGGFIDDVQLCRVFCAEEQVTNGGFEDAQVRAGSFAHLRSLTGWRLQSGDAFEVQRIYNSFDGQQYLELAAGKPAHVTQSFATDSGSRYVLRFAHSPRPGVGTNSVEVRWGDKVVVTAEASGVGNSGTEWNEYTALLDTYGETGVLAFIDRSAPDGAAGFIDAVRLCRIRYSDLEVKASYDLEYACDRSSGYIARVVLDIEGGVPPYTCSGRAGVIFEKGPVAGQCRGVTSTGKQSFTVMDATGASKTVMLDVKWVIELAVVDVRPPSACGLSDGAATVQATSKAPPFNYRWNDPRQQVTPTATGLAPGTYRVTVTNEEGCRETATVTIPRRAGC
jgi:hypothetical protein